MIAAIRLQHFRSYADSRFSLAPAVNIIVGPNGSGKTNLLEALLVVARGSSYRVRDSELVQYEEPWARLDASVGEDTRTVKIINEPLPSKSYEVEGKQYKRLIASKQLPAVIFEPNHLLMLSGSPELRRGYLDDLLEQTVPGYGKLKRDYKRVLAQRNTLLKRSGMAARGEMFPWDVRLSDLGGSIAVQRSELVMAINEAASDLYGSLADKPTDVRLEYQSKFKPEHYASGLLKALESHFELDVARGFTGNGPHREDFTVSINGHGSQLSASRGETRTAVLMLKIIELQRVEQAAGRRPLLLLDDVFSELDGSRRQALTGYLQDYQTFITTTDADMVAGYFGPGHTVIRLNQPG